MSVNQVPKRERGRPFSMEAFKLPPELAHHLNKIGFFNPENNRFSVWPWLQNADMYDRKYRFRATMTRIIAIVGRNSVETLFGKSWKQINRYLDGASIPVAVLDLAAQVADIPVAWVMTGDAHGGYRWILEAASNPTILAGISEDRRKLLTAGAHKIVSEFPNFDEAHKNLEGIVNIHNNELRTSDDDDKSVFGVGEKRAAIKRLIQTLADGYILVPRYAVRASAGFGEKVFDDPPGSAWPVPREMLRSFSGNPDRLASINLAGDSMWPTFFDGDPIIFDRSSKHIEDDFVYVLSVSDELFVKRVQRIPLKDGTMSLELISDNPAYQRITLDSEGQEHVLVHGRVIWPNTTRRR